MLSARIPFVIGLRGEPLVAITLLSHENSPDDPRTFVIVMRGRTGCRRSVQNTTTRGYPRKGYAAAGAWKKGAADSLIGVTAQASSVGPRGIASKIESVIDERSERPFGSRDRSE